MANYYCVFWYPTIFHQEKRHRRVDLFYKDGVPIFQSIADIDKRQDVPDVIGADLSLHIEEVPHKENKRNDEDCFDLVFTLHREGLKDIKTVFEYYDHSRNGFVIYSYNRESLLNDFWCSFNDNSKIIEILRHTFSIRISEKYSIKLTEPLDEECVKNHTIDWVLISFYHLAKFFYHEHEVHNDADAKLESYYYKEIDSHGRRTYLTEPPSLSTKNNPVINWYLDQYEKMFLQYAEKTSQDYRQRKFEIDEFLNLRKEILAAAYNEEASPGELSDLIIKLRTTFDKIPIVKHDDKQVSKILPKSDEYGKRPLPGADNTPVPPIDEIIKEKKPTTFDINGLKRELKEKTKEFYLPYVNYLYNQVATLSEICHNALIEYTYCRVLLGSKYNDEYQHNIFFNSREVELLSENPQLYPFLSKKDEHRKKAFNIRNSIRYIEDIRQKCDILESALSKILIEEVHGISIDHESILKSINKLNETNNSVLENIASLTNANNNVLGNISNLTQANSDVLQDIEKLNQETVKSNVINSTLGWLSVGIGVLGLAYVFGETHCPNIILLVISALILLPAIIKAVIYGLKNNRSMYKKRR